jgi:hypothetical protein
MPRREDLGDPHSSIFGRPCILGILEKLGSALPRRRETLLGQALALDDARDEAIHRVHEDEGRHLAGREHVVADGYLVRDILLDDPLIEAFVAAADDDELLLAGEFGGVGLVQEPARGRYIDGPPRGPAVGAGP